MIWVYILWANRLLFQNEVNMNKVKLAPATRQKIMKLFRKNIKANGIFIFPDTSILVFENSPFGSIYQPLVTKTFSTMVYDLITFSCLNKTGDENVKTRYLIEIYLEDNKLGFILRPKTKYRLDETHKPVFELGLHFEEE